jgi:hypothetical protein
MQQPKGHIFLGASMPNNDAGARRIIMVKGYDFGVSLAHGGL